METALVIALALIVLLLIALAALIFVMVRDRRATRKERDRLLGQRDD